jgi:hypothetical protein
MLNILSNKLYQRTNFVDEVIETVYEIVMG